MCLLLRVSRSGFYAWRRRRPSQREYDDLRIGGKVAAAHRDSLGTYGRRRVRAELAAGGERVGIKRIDRLMSQRGLSGRSPRKFRRPTTDSRHDDPIAPDLVQRYFTASRPSRLWVGDTTEFKTGEGPHYLATLTDVWSRRIVGWAVSDRNDAQLVLAALAMAAAARGPLRALIHHSDRGSTYASLAYRLALKRLGATASMGSTGDCYDNAMAESVFATLSRDLPNLGRHATRDSSLIEIGEYIERFYNCRRRHSAIGYMCPIEFEARHRLMPSTT
jgi:transposase InsO family protein